MLSKSEIAKELASKSLTQADVRALAALTGDDIDAATEELLGFAIDGRTIDESRQHLDTENRIVDASLQHLDFVHQETRRSAASKFLVNFVTPRR